MKAFLINTPGQTVQEIDYGGDWRTIHDLVHCKVFTLVRTGWSNDVVIYVDDEGLINGNPYGWFTVEGYGGALRGYGLVLGTDNEGESVAPKMTLGEVQNRVEFLSDEDIRQRLRDGRIQ